MIEAGSVLFSFSVATAALSLGTGVWGMATRNRSILALSRQSVMLHFFVLALSELILLYLLVIGDYSVDYVLNYVSNNLPIFYRISALWAGNAGSLLFWNFLIALFSAIAVRHVEKEEPTLVPPMIIILMGISLFFSLVGNFTENSDPFTMIIKNGIPYHGPEGRGLSPLLQHWAMVIHPPTLLIGYAAFSVPFAIAMASLITGRVNLNWTRLVRRWTLFSWSFLGAGMMLGGKWAYEELGWGGYWFWDPVENSSLMPWLSSTAFLHSILVQEKREMFKTWNMVLVTISFFLCIFGTFITRSGLINSVHSFANTGLGLNFAIFLGIIIIFSVYWITRRSSELRSDRPMNSFLSREAGFLFNNMLLIFMVIVILLGTMWANVSELLTGEADQKTQTWFDNRMAPLGLILLFLTGAGPLLSWRKTSGKTLWKNFRFPMAVFFIALIAGFAYTHYTISPVELAQYKPLALTCFALCGFVFTGVIEEFVRTTLARTRVTHENFLLGLLLILFQNKRRFMGYSIHLGIAFMFIGFTGLAYAKEYQFKLHPKGIEYFDGYTIEVADYKVYPTFDVSFANLPKDGPGYKYEAVSINIYKNNRLVGSTVTEKRYYPMYSPVTESYGDPQPTSEPGIISNGFGDIKIQYARPDATDDNRLIIQVKTDPLINFLWFGMIFYHVFILFLLLPIGENKAINLFGKKYSLSPVAHKPE
ncbi:MAG: cytochrome c biogenesis protein CcsA [Leptospirales bacterium]